MSVRSFLDDILDCEPYSHRIFTNKKKIFKLKKKLVFQQLMHRLANRKLTGDNFETLTKLPPKMEEKGVPVLTKYLYDQQFIDPNTNDKNNDQKDDSISTESSALKLNNEHCSETSTESNKTQKSPTAPTPPMSHMRFHRRRGPPAGYVMGPGGGAISTSARVNQAISTNNYHGSNGQNYPGHVNAHENGFSPRGGRGRGRFFSRGRGGRNSNFHHGGSYGRGRSGRGRGRGRFDGDGRGRGRFDGDQQDHRSVDENDSRGIKRNWDDNRKEQDSDGFRDEDGGGRGSYGRGGYRGGRASWGGNRGSFRGGRGNYARGRGRY